MELTQCQALEKPSYQINTYYTKEKENEKNIGQRILRELEKFYEEKNLEKLDKNKIHAKIELIDPNDIIRSKQMKYTRENQEENQKQIGELLELGLIRPSISPQSSPRFLVRNMLYLTLLVVPLTKSFGQVYPKNSSG